MANRTELRWKVIGCAIEVHRRLGPGLLESAYGSCLAEELAINGLKFMTQVPVPVIYRGRQLQRSYRADFVVEGLLVIEIKCVDRLIVPHSSQIVTYMRLLRVPMGLLLNFKARRLKDDMRTYEIELD